ncbi:MAG: DUF1569 domain-containing protein [Planctomycetota bacterium]
MSQAPERRELSFDNLDAAVADAERLSAGEVRTTGNHSFAEIMRHLALTHDMATGKLVAPRPPFYMRLLMPFLKGFILRGPVRPGFKLPRASEEFFWPDTEIDVASALQYLRESVDNYKRVGPLAIHPMFGKLSREQVDRLNASHCAMHLSFVHPVG